MAVRFSRVAFPMLCVMVIFGCGDPHDDPVGPSTPAVSTAEVQIRRVELTVPLIGKAESAQTVALRALVEGRVLTIGAADGDHVEAGTVVFELGGPRAAARRTVLEADVRTAEQNIEAATNRREQAQRRKKDHLAAPGEVSRAEVDLSAAQSRLATAGAELERFLVSVAVAAPVSGRLSGRRVSRGQEVRPGDVLGELLEPGAIRISAQILPRPGLDPKPGQPAVIDGADGSDIMSTVTAIQPMVAGAGTTQVWLGGDGLRVLAPGTAVHGHIVVAVHEEAVTVPPAAVVRDSEDRPLVFVTLGQDHEKRSVTAGQEGPDWIEITSGLKPGERVVTEGAYEIYWAQFGQEFKVED